MQTDDREESLITHLEALRETLLKCIVSLCVALPFTLWAAPVALDWLIKTIAVIAAFPYMAKKVWDFILPALYDNERKFIKTAVLSSTLLFVCGAAFCILVILPLVIKFGLSFAAANVEPVFGISNIMNLTLMMSIAFGIMFQMPLVTIALIRSGVISYETVSDKRPYVIVIILILAAIFTPPDVVSQLMLGVPTYLLFELGLLLARINNKKIKVENV